MASKKVDMHPGNESGPMEQKGNGDKGGGKARKPSPEDKKFDTGSGAKQPKSFGDLPPRVALSGGQK